jgi:hypothetical protein
MKQSKSYFRICMISQAGLLLITLVMFASIAISCALEPTNPSGSISFSLPSSMTKADGDWEIRYLLYPDGATANYATPISAANYPGSEFYFSMVTKNVGSYVVGAPTTNTVLIEGLPPRRQIRLIVHVTKVPNAYTYTSGSDVVLSYADAYGGGSVFDIEAGQIATTSVTRLRTTYYC